MKTKLPSFMKLMECECGWTLFSIDAQPCECPTCYKLITKEKTRLSYDVCKKCCEHYLPKISHNEEMFNWMMLQCFEKSWHEFEAAGCPVNNPSGVSWSPSIHEDPPEYCPYKEEHNV
jgi:hypothetical protein